MPTIHIQVAGQANTPDGKTVQLPNAVAMQQRGPYIQLTIGLEQTMVQALVQQGKPVPSSRVGRALIDTGASVSCIDEKVATELGLPVVDVGKMTSATHDGHPCNLYPVQFTIAPGISFGVPRALGANLTAQGFIGIVGRDFLSMCTLYYNGGAGQITLSI